MPSFAPPLKRPSAGSEKRPSSSSRFGPVRMPMPAAEGTAVPGPTRSWMESRLGHSFENVRLHADGPAADVAGRFGARAVTIGNDIFFRTGELQPGTSRGTRLLAHELTHVAQHGLGGPAPRPGASRPGDAAEREAERIAARVAVGAPAPPVTQPAPAAVALKEGETTEKAPSDIVNPWPDEPQVDDGMDWPAVINDIVDPWAKTNATAQSPADITLPDPAEFGADYKSKKSHAQHPYEEYKAAIGTNKDQPEIKAASAWAGGTPLVPPAIAGDELKRILNPGKDADLDGKLDQYLPDINKAFETMGIDTVEAQANYFAHAAGETGGLKTLGEQTIQNKAYGRFYGRGPVQVTWEDFYVQALAYLQAQAEILIKLPDEQSKKNAVLCQEAVNAIKTNPDAAADARYSFLFSAATMHMMSAVKGSGTAGHYSDVSGGADLTGNLKAARERLAKAQADLKAAQTDDEKTKATGQVETAKKDAQEWQSTVDRRQVKIETYDRAKRVLLASGRAVPKTAAGPAAAATSSPPPPAAPQGSGP